MFTSANSPSFFEYEILFSFADALLFDCSGDSSNISRIFCCCFDSSFPSLSCFKEYSLSSCISLLLTVVSKLDIMPLGDLPRAFEPLTANILAEGKSPFVILPTLYIVAISSFTPTDKVTS